MEEYLINPSEPQTFKPTNFFKHYKLKKNERRQY